MVRFIFKLIKTCVPPRIRKNEKVSVSEKYESASIPILSADTITDTEFWSPTNKNTILHFTCFFSEYSYVRGFSWLFWICIHWRVNTRNIKQMPRAQYPYIFCPFSPWENLESSNSATSNTYKAFICIKPNSFWWGEFFLFF